MYYHIKYHGKNWQDSIYWSSNDLETEIANCSKYNPNAEITIYSTDDVISEKFLTLTNRLFEHLKSQKKNPILLRLRNMEMVIFYLILDLIL